MVSSLLSNFRPGSSGSPTEKINIKIVKKYLLISLESKFIFVNISLFIKIFLGLLKDKI